INCGYKFDDPLSKFTASGISITTDPTADIDNLTTLIPVADSNAYTVGEVIVMGGGLNTEYALVRGITSSTEIETIRGISSTSPAPHLATSGITPNGRQSDDVEIIVAPDPGGRIGAYSTGLGLKSLIEPNLELAAGSYTGTITFSLYPCNGSASCLDI
ncbi:MAG TPA: hypothetical protein VI588_04445, partial [Candidatus Gracilibacteria bacterium]|nr:hypothetical protein [Candidatus Gracilibacteria bacterium]